MVQVEQSVPICLGLAAAGGAIEVLATAVLAYQDAQEKEGRKWTRTARYAALTLNIVLQLCSSTIGNLFAPWFGPVSLVGPVFLSSQLLANMLVFGIILGIEMFTKDMQVGTYVVVIAVILLPIVGPTAQEDQDIATLLETWYSLLWSAILLVGMTLSTFLLLVLNVPKLKERQAISLLLMARATAFTVNLTVSKVLIMNVDKYIFGLSIFLKVTSGAVQTYAIVVQSTAVTQAKFVPLNASALIIVNALTGMIIWQDWLVVGNWIGYVCVFVQLVLGNYLLLGDVELLSPDNTHYGRAKSILMVKGRDDWDPSLYDIDEESSEEEEEALSADGETALDNSKYMSITTPSVIPVHANGHRRQQRRSSTAQEAWSSVYGLNAAHVPPRRHSIFVMDSSGFSELR